MGEGPERSDVRRDLHALVDALLDLGDGWSITVLPNGQLALIQHSANETQHPAEVVRSVDRRP